MKKRAVSAPYWSISACGSTPLFFDFDIVPMPPESTGRAVRARFAETILPLASRFDLDFGRIDPLAPARPASRK